MNAADQFAKFVGRHPFFTTVMVVLLFGGMGVLDQRSDELAAAYRQGAIDARGNAPSVTDQLKNICSQPWPDVAGSVEARDRVCPKE